MSSEDLTKEIHAAEAAPSVEREAAPQVEQDVQTVPTPSRQQGHQTAPPAEQTVQQKPDAVPIFIGPLELLRGENVIGKFSGRDCGCARPKLLWREDTIWLTNRRIVVKQVAKLCSIPVVSKTDCFRYGDCHNMSFQLDRRLRYLVPSIPGISAALALFEIDAFAAIFIGVFLLVVGIVLLLYFLSRLCSKEELKLDFYKGETVNTWLFVLDQLFIRRGGSSITVSLALDPQDASTVIKLLYEHDLTHFLEDKEV